MSEAEELPEPLLVVEENLQPSALNEGISPLNVNPSIASESEGAAQAPPPPQYEQEFMGVIEAPPPVSSKRLKRFHRIQVFSGICVLISLVMTFALPPLLLSVIKDKAKDQVIFKPQTQIFYAHFPGQSGTQIIRNYTFFKMQNQDQFLFFGQKPRFREVNNYKIQQMEDFLDIKYIEDGNKIRLRDYIWFKEWHESNSLDEKVTILNMANLGYWAKLKAARPTLLLQQGLALIFTNLQNSIMSNLLGQGIQQQFLQNSSVLYSSIMAPAGISKDNIDFLWENAVYGMGNQENLGTWAQAAIDCFENQQKQFTFSNDSIVLKNFFALSETQIKVIMTKMYSYVLGLRQLLLNNHYCQDIQPSQCTGRLLGVAQLSEGWATSYLPPVQGVIPNDTICDGNTTCKGKYPEPNAYIKNVFNMTPEVQKILGFSRQTASKVSFQRQTILNWFNYNKSIQADLNYNTAQNCLLHIGNLDILWQWGSNFDQDYDVKWLQLIGKRFGLSVNQLQQPFVFWSWIKYFANQFVLQKGNNQQLGIANIFTQGFYQQFSYLQDNLQPFLLASMLQQNLKGKECKQFFSNSLNNDESPQPIDDVCKHYSKNHKSIQQFSFATKMISICEHKYGPQWTKLRSIGVSLTAMDNHCDITLMDSVGYMIYQHKLALDQHYGCHLTPNPICSNYELAVQQWQDSNVTINPPKILRDKLPITTTFKTWNKHAKAIQYNHFIQKFPQEEQKNFTKYNMTQLVGKLTFEGWFSTNLNLNLIINEQFDPYFFKYIRYVGIFVTLNGFSATRTVRQFLFGYQDDFLNSIRTQYPPFGGDPSAPALINFNDLNVTAEQCTLQLVLGTGKSDSSQVNHYYQINGYSYLVNNYSFFNGNRTSWQWLTPWAQNDYFYGTNGKMFGPDVQTTDNLSLLIPNVQRYGSNFFHNQTIPDQRYGQELHRSFLNGQLGKVKPENAKYYQTIPNVFNVSSIYGLPLYVTKNHFMNCTKWLQLVDIRIGNSSEFYTEISKWDDTFAIVQPFTGVSFQSNIYLQNNYYHQKDLLYDYDVTTLLPVFSINRGGNLTEQKYHQFFDPLVSALSVKKGIFIAGIVLTVISAVIFVYSTYKKRKLTKYLQNDNNDPLDRDSLTVQQLQKKKKRKEESLLQDDN